MRVNPAWDEAWRELGYTCQDSGNFLRAEASMRQAVALQPGYAGNWRALANLLLKSGKSGRYDEARDAYRHVIELEPRQNSGYEGMAMVEMFAGRNAEAAAWFKKLPREVTTAPLASNVANAFFFDRQLGEALRYYRKAVELGPKRADYRANLGDCYQRMGRADSARAQYREAARLDEIDLRVSPSDAEKVTQLVMYLAKAGDCERSWAEYRKQRTLLARHDDNSEIQRSLAKAFTLCGHRTEALAALRRMAATGAATDLLASEDEFASLRGDPAFRALLRAKVR
jgi:Flp pilus assembly protein TadD